MKKKEGTAKSQKYPLNCINQIIIVTMIKEDSKSKMECFLRNPSFISSNFDDAHKKRLAIAFKKSHNCA